jgi:dGTPase
MITTREQREALEAQTLAPYAVRSGDSRGRPHPEAEDTHRTRFQRDRDRIIHTTAFRRLEYKTQVFVNFEGDYYRTRLTHTLEVAQIGRSLARALSVNEDLVETLCLAHDMGHPPFGHAGEEALDMQMKDHGGFRHNAQTYRIVTELEERYPAFPGLNLTLETLDGIQAHGGGGTLEAQIADFADEMAYNAHDLDDGLRAGLIELRQLDGLEIWELLKESIGWDGRAETYGEMTRHELVRRLTSLQSEDAIAATEARLQNINPASPAAIVDQPQFVIGYSDHFDRMNRALKIFIREKLINHFRVQRMGFKAGQFISQLFQTYHAHPGLLPTGIQSKIDQRGVARTVADYIAGMTDRYALQEWERLFDPFKRP